MQISTTFSKKPGPLGLGSAIKVVTGAVGIRHCGGCQKRAEALDKLVPNINPFASQKKP